MFSARYVYQTYATNSFSQHSLVSTVQVVRAVIGAAIQPLAAKVSDVFGRKELVFAAAFLYVIGKHCCILEKNRWTANCQPSTFFLIDVTLPKQVPLSNVHATTCPALRPEPSSIRSGTA